MARKHFLLVLLSMLFIAPLVITGRITAIESALAQALSGGGTAANAPSYIRNTRHNLSSTAKNRSYTSATGGGSSATTEAIVKTESASVANDEVCVYCHTPHGASTTPGTPLWNRALNNTTYTPYSSSSLQATDLDVTSAALAAPSKLCLSCHDGTLAIGQVSNAPGSGTGGPIPLLNTSAGASASTTGTMPYGRGQANANHGFTRNLGKDLRNDHPISFTYNAALATADGELRSPPSSSPTQIANRSPGVKPHFPLTDGKMQCTTCHDPHKETQKFLRKNRLAQGSTGPEAVQSSYTDWTFEDNTDQICVACHTRLGKSWAQSAHANSTVANETYKTGEAALRDFPTSTKVWQAGCLNCHDTHTVAGSRRLLREGVNTSISTVSPGAVGYSARFRIGTTSSADYDTTSALENTCYQCHTTSTNAAISVSTMTSSEGVPNIESEFSRAIRMPIVNSEQGLPGGNSKEVHDITDRDTMESPSKLGYMSKESRHVECTDCHNPHRVVKADTFLGGNLSGGDTTLRTHVPARGTTGSEGNIASGVLRGAWGVEPSYTSVNLPAGNAWMGASEVPTFTVKKGDPGAASTLPVGTAGTNAVNYLTREYQLCFKCHSSYANGTNTTDFPDLGRTGGTTSNTQGTGGGNKLTRYTDIAREMAVIAEDPPKSGTDQGENGNDPAYTPSNPNGAPNGAPVNHRSWHPVVFPTGRTMRERRNNTNNDFGNIRAPFNDSNKVGKQTMHCSDCHGSEQAWQTTTGADRTKVQGPHGSNNPFLLKGTWVGPDSGGNWGTSTTRLDTFNSHLCGNCHNPTGGAGGFSSGSEASHNSSKKNVRPCMWCHVAVPHGWRNKALLVNMNCVGPEGGGSGCQDNVISDTGNLTSPPYYIGARLRVWTWKSSASWSENSCNSPAMVADSKPGGDFMKSACGDL